MLLNFFLCSVVPPLPPFVIHSGEVPQYKLHSLVAVLLLSLILHCLAALLCPQCIFFMCRLCCFPTLCYCSLVR